MAATGHELRRLTSLRWFAALAVLLCHLGEQPFGPHQLVPLGPIGVSFFFVLSGFVLTWSARPDDTARKVWLRRFARIYPSTAAAMLISVVCMLLAVPHSHISSIWSFLAGMLVIQAWFPQLSVSEVGPGVTWSLACEAFFYALLPVLLLVARRWPRASGWSAVTGCLVVLGVTVQSGSDYLYMCPAGRLPEFVIGVVLAVAVQRGWRPSLPTPLAWLLFAAGYWLVISASMAPQTQVYVALPGVVAVIASAAGSDLAGHRGWLTSRPLVYLGELSFCFYLLHAMVIRVVVISADTSAVALGALGFVTLIFTLAAAALLHHMVELPMQRRILGRHPAARQIGMPQPRQVMVAVSRHQTST